MMCQWCSCQWYSCQRCSCYSLLRYLTRKIQDGNIYPIICPDSQCSMLVPCDVIEGLVSRDVARKYQQFDVEVSHILILTRFKLFPFGFFHYCIVPRCSVTFWTHPEIISMGQFFRRWIKSINQSINQSIKNDNKFPQRWWNHFALDPFDWLIDRLIDWLIDDKSTLTWLVYWICTIRSVVTRVGLECLNIKGWYSISRSVFVGL